MVKRRRNITRKVYKARDYNSGEGMLTSVWGPPLWHFLHLMSFNYPVRPSCADKQAYRNFMLQLRYILPCSYCRKNLCKNLKTLPLRLSDLKNRRAFSLWVFKLHEQVNKMLGKTSGLTYAQVRERYEHFRSRCTQDGKTAKVRKRKKMRKTRKRKKESGCTEPLYGKKSQCVVKIVPKDSRVKSFQMDKECIKRRK